MNKCIECFPWFSSNKPSPLVTYDEVEQTDPLIGVQPQDPTSGTSNRVLSCNGLDMRCHRVKQSASCGAGGFDRLLFEASGTSIKEAAHLATVIEVGESNILLGSLQLAGCSLRIGSALFDLSGSVQNAESDAAPDPQPDVVAETGADSREPSKVLLSAWIEQVGPSAKLICDALSEVDQLMAKLRKLQSVYESRQEMQQALEGVDESGEGAGSAEQRTVIPEAFIHALEQHRETLVVAGRRIVSAIEDTHPELNISENRSTYSFKQSARVGLDMTSLTSEISYLSRHVFPIPLALAYSGVSLIVSIADGIHNEQLIRSHEFLLSNFSQSSVDQASSEHELEHVKSIRDNTKQRNLNVLRATAWGALCTSSTLALMTAAPHTYSLMLALTGAATLSATSLTRLLDSCKRCSDQGGEEALPPANEGDVAEARMRSVEASTEQIERLSRYLQEGDQGKRFERGLSTSASFSLSKSLSFSRAPSVNLDIRPLIEMSAGEEDGLSSLSSLYSISHTLGDLFGENGLIDEDALGELKIMLHKQHADLSMMNRAMRWSDRLGPSLSYSNDLF